MLNETQMLFISIGIFLCCMFPGKSSTRWARSTQNV